MTFGKIISLTLAFTAIALISTTAQEVSVSRESSYKGTHKWRTSTGVTDFNIELRGTIELTDDDRDIKSMSDDGYLEINKTVFGSRRTIIIESLGGGKLKKEYYEGRTQMKWEPNGQAWLSEILPDIVRNTTVGAESRVTRFFRQGGTPRVLSKIKNIRSDHVKTHYAKLLMKQNVPVKDYVTVVNTLSDEVDSDHYITEFLKSNISKFMSTKEGTSALFMATKKIGSDHYKTVVIKEALRGEVASADNVRIILQAASQMESDHYITEVLTSLLKQDNLNDAVVGEMITTTNAIESDHYKTVVLTRALDKRGLSASSHQKVIESIKDIESDHYITQVIKHLLKDKLTDQLLGLLLDVTSSIDSDHYRSEVLRELLERQDLTDSQFDKLLYSVSDIDSDHYATTVLQEILRNSELSDNKLIGIMKVAGKIGSDHYTTQVLQAAAPRVKSGSSVVKDAYRAAARNISSETYYGRALRAIE